MGGIAIPIGGAVGDTKLRFNPPLVVMLLVWLLARWSLSLSLFKGSGELEGERSGLSRFESEAVVERSDILVRSPRSLLSPLSLSPLRLLCSCRGEVARFTAFSDRGESWTCKGIGDDKIPISPFCSRSFVLLLIELSRDKTGE